jgi:hypothetical protein
MPTMRITVVHKEDPAPWGDLLDRKVLALDPETPWHVVIIEAGMDSGAPSIALRIDLEDGTPLIAETSLAAWLTATAAFRGAFPEAFKGGPFEAVAHG